jgi:hypothetical protein
LEIPLPPTPLRTRTKEAEQRALESFRENFNKPERIFYLLKELWATVLQYSCPTISTAPASRGGMSRWRGNYPIRISTNGTDPITEKIEHLEAMLESSSSNEAWQQELKSSAEGF